MEKNIYGDYSESAMLSVKSNEALLQAKLDKMDNEIKDKQYQQYAENYLIKLHTSGNELDDEWAIRFLTYFSELDPEKNRKNFLRCYAIWQMVKGEADET